MRSIENLPMSPREKHVPNDAVRTTVGLTAQDRAAINWISTVRRLAKSKRLTINDILVDSLWFYLEKTEGKTKGQISAMVPALPLAKPAQSNVTTMPRPRSKR
jgi:hypothetical protein